MAERVAAHPLGDPGAKGRRLHRALQDGLVQVMPAALAGQTVDVDARGRERPLPGPLAARVGVLRAEGPRQLDPAGARLEIDLMLVPDHNEVPQHPHHDLVAREIDVLHAQAGALEQAEPCAIEEDRLSRGTPWISASTARTSSGVRTTGRWCGRFA